MEKDYGDSLAKELKKADESRMAKAHARAARKAEDCQPEASSELPDEAQVAQAWEESNNIEHSVIADLNTMAAERLVKPKSEPDSANGLITAENAPKSKARRSISGNEDVVSQYEIISELERKGLGVTFSARNLETNRIETLKLRLPKGYLLSQNVSSPSPGASSVGKGILIAILILMGIAAAAFLVVFYEKDGRVSPTLGPAPTIGVDPAQAPEQVQP